MRLPRQPRHPAARTRRVHASGRHRAKSRTRPERGRHSSQLLAAEEGAILATSCGRWTSTCWGRRSKLVSPCVAAHLWRRRSRFTPSPPSPPRLAARRCRVAARLRPSLTVCLVPADSPTVPLGNCRLNSPSDRAATLPSARVQWSTCAHTRSILTPHRRALSGKSGEPATAATAATAVGRAVAAAGVEPAGSPLLRAPRVRAPAVCLTAWPRASPCPRVASRSVWLGG